MDKTEKLAWWQHEHSAENDITAEFQLSRNGGRWGKFKTQHGKNRCLLTSHSDCDDSQISNVVPLDVTWNHILKLYDPLQSHDIWCWVTEHFQMLCNWWEGHLTLKSMDVTWHYILELSDAFKAPVHQKRQSEMTSNLLHFPQFAILSRVLKCSFFLCCFGVPCARWHH